MTSFSRMLTVAALVIAAGSAAVGADKVLRVGVVQLEMTPTPDTPLGEMVQANLAKCLRFIQQAHHAGCQLVVFPEHTLYWHMTSAKRPVQVSENVTLPAGTDYQSLSRSELPPDADIDRALEEISRAARKYQMHIILGDHIPSRQNNRGFVFGPDGELEEAYWKNKEVPRPFDVAGVTCNFLICSDRWYLEQSDLPTLAQGAQVIVDISGGHGGDDGRTGDLHLIRYRPWAQRTNAFVLVSNPMHASIDFMGHSPWGGGSAVIGPRGDVLAHKFYEKDEMIVADLRIDEATLAAARQRRNHPLLKEFWDVGERLLRGESIAPVPEIAPYRSRPGDVTIAAAQIVCGSDVGENTDRIVKAIGEAADKQADIVVFPELALTGNRRESIVNAKPQALDEALHRVRRAARERKISVIVGAPRISAAGRENCAYVIGDDGEVKTCYAQISAGEDGVFQPGMSSKAMWFELDGVHSIVTIGDDADWVELPDLAASRGMILHFHLTNEQDGDSDAAVLRTQRNLLALQYGHFGAAVNAADPAAASESSESEFPRRGGSLLVSREGGHNQPAPPGVECYLPYQTSIIQQAGRGEQMLIATRRTPATNSRDLNNRQNRARRARPEDGWIDWIKTGVRQIEAEVPRQTTAAN